MAGPKIRTGFMKPLFELNPAFGWSKKTRIKMDGLKILRIVRSLSNFLKIGRYEIKLLEE